VVLLHDSLGSVVLWRDFPERIAEATGLGVLAYDRRGHGASDPFGPEPRTRAYLHEEAATLEQVLAAANVREAVLFGHSDGGSIALLAAALHPARALRGASLGQPAP
jgi:pimeloyl-ACP methyl ester carboxylesterase